MSDDKSEAYRKRLSQELTSSLFREDAGTWSAAPNEMDMVMLADDAFQETMYYGSQGPPSVHSTGSRHNSYHTGPYDPQVIDLFKKLIFLFNQFVSL